MGKGCIPFPIFFQNQKIISALKKLQKHPLKLLLTAINLDDTIAVLFFKLRIKFKYIEIYSRFLFYFTFSCFRIPQ